MKMTGVILQMNYLAHAVLSFNDREIMVGNMISDFVKGKKKFEYSLQVQHGIALHRAIDEFTDTHPETKKAKQFFRPQISDLHDPFLMKDMDKAVNRILSAIEKKEKINIVVKKNFN